MKFLVFFSLFLNLQANAVGDIERNSGFCKDEQTVLSNLGCLQADKKIASHCMTISQYDGDGSPRDIRCPIGMQQAYKCSDFAICTGDKPTELTNLCFNPTTLSGDTMSLKLQNLSKIVEKNLNGKPSLNCIFNRLTIPSQLSILAYKTDTGDCESELRTCTEGKLSGSYPYSKCNKDFKPVGVKSKSQKGGR